MYIIIVLYKILLNKISLGFYVAIIGTSELFVDLCFFFYK